MPGDPETPTSQQAVRRAPPAPVHGASAPRPRPPGPNDVQRAAPKAEPPKQSLMKPRPWWISFILVLVVNYLLVQFFLPATPPTRIDVPYTFFKQQVAAGNVSEITSRADVIQGLFKQAVTYPPDQPTAPISVQFQTV